VTNTPQPIMDEPSSRRARPGSGEMFDAIAARYDMVNRVLSFGIDQSWRKATVAALQIGSGARVLDVATGTGDLAIQVARSAADVRVVGLDPSAKMLEIGRQKVQSTGLTERVELCAGDAQELPFGDSEFDGVCIAFGIRNVPDRARALSEMARVTRPGGRVAILELSEPRGLLAPIARLHVHTLVPWVGALLSGAREYRYLERSIAAFPPPEQFAEMMQQAGLDVALVRPMTFGACHLFVGERRLP
jgi:demethylmenaquinone methyltransferase / 2-methoxy-6-polyprenyl-1,4-benzoquinol methylase